MNEEVIPIVHQWIDGRDAEGTIKYGQPLRTFDGRNSDTDAIEEALDLVNYLVKRLMEREEVAALCFDAAVVIGLLAKENYGEKSSGMVKRLLEVSRNLRADVPRIGVPATRHLSGGPMSRLEDMEKS